MDRFEIAHSITVEAIRAGINRPDEITSLFERIAALAPTDAVLVAPPSAAAADEEPEETPPSEPLLVQPLAETTLVEEPRAETPPKPEPATVQLTDDQIAATMTHDHIRCLECGKKLRRMLQHLRVKHGLTPDDYIAKWGLPSDYPMNSASYIDMLSKRTTDLIKRGVFGNAKTSKKKAGKTREALIG